MKLNPERTFAVSLGSTLIGAAIADGFAHDTPWVYFGAAVGFVLGMALTITGQRKDSRKS